MLTRPDAARLIALATLDRVADGSPAGSGRWSWSNPDDYDATRAAILDVDAATAKMPPHKAAALRSAVAHVLACADWYADDLLTDAAEDDSRLALETAIDAVPFLCPLGGKRVR